MLGRIAFMKALEMEGAIFRDGGGNVHSLTATDRTGCCTSRWSVCLCNTLKLCQSIVVAVLVAAVIVMGLQLHALQQTVATEESKIAALQLQVTSQHQNQEDLTQRVDKEHSLTLYQMAGTFTLLTCLLTAFHITQHLNNFHEAVIQRKIIAILWMSPIYSVTSFFSLVFPVADGYLAVIRDFYEAYTIYTFLSFLIAVLGRGNRETAVQVLACHADHLKPPTSCFKSYYYPPPETSSSAMASAVLMECQILAMQFVLIRPVTSILSFVSDTLVVYDTASPNEADRYSYFESPNFYIAMITNVSVFFAFNGLLKFYHAVRDDLRWCQPFSKFLSVKSIVFLTFWQGLLVTIIVNVHYHGGGAAAVPGTGVATIPVAPPTTHAIMTLAPVHSPIQVTGSPPTDSTTRHPPALWKKPASLPSPKPVPPPTLAPTTLEGETIDLTKKTNNSTRHRLLSGNTTTTTTTTTKSSSNTENDESSHERASQIQNFLICLEMLFFSIAHWCVFPAEEWKPDYRPQQHYAKPGIGLKDFASDISYIMSSSSQRRKYHSTMSSRSNSNEEEEDVSETVDSSYDDGLVVKFADAEVNVSDEV